MTKDPSNPKDIAGEKKPPIHLIPLSAKIAESLALKNGADKYGPYNWRDLDIQASAYIAATQRHIDLWWDCGEEEAKDSGIHHLGHAMASLAILYDALVNDGIIDNRPPPSKSSALMDSHTKDMKPQPKEQAPRTISLEDAIKELMVRTQAGVAETALRQAFPGPDFKEIIDRQFGSTHYALDEETGVIVERPLGVLDGETLTVNPFTNLAQVRDADGEVVEETSAYLAEGFSESVTEYIAPDAIQIDIAKD